ncbi:response regulator receiver modulated diguanylate cyclase [Thalassoporum mexicanum PCC 7367]|uniref:diguanylate cyclase domain-containing protein n=1 Tax=Thalassoporum mexicanum TaxID=3457544 RepID=UPI00029FAA60|nr:diguanylate cyclase [Pseudanabaena sp. PCC 7367]AFY71047.1 response regulator receiver modulated diguanylate cyclase [Pseudanabaena sp. PCC 7367]
MSLYHLKSDTYQFSHNNQPRVLVVSTNNELVKQICSILIKYQFAFEIANLGEQAWQMINRNCPDLVICDWEIPDMSGLALCQRIKAGLINQSLSRVYFVAVIADRQKEQRAMGIEVGIDEFVYTPIDEIELSLRVRSGCRASVTAKLLGWTKQKLAIQEKLFKALELTDRATGLLTQQSMQLGLPRFLAELEQQNFDRTYLNLMLLGVSQYEQVRDKYGNRIAAEVMGAIAGRIRNKVEADSILCHYGCESGNELICITTNIDPNCINDLGQRLLAAVSTHPIAVDGGLLLPMNLNIGSVVCQLSADLDFPQLIEQGHQLLAKAKQDGKNCMRIADISAQTPIYTA